MTSSAIRSRSAGGQTELIKALARFFRAVLHLSQSWKEKKLNIDGVDSVLRRCA